MRPRNGLSRTEVRGIYRFTSVEKSHKIGNNKHYWVEDLVLDADEGRG